MKNYFDLIFKNPNNIDSESRLYPYTLSRQLKAINSNKEAFESVKATIGDLTLRDVMESPQLLKESGLGDSQHGSASLDNYIPQIFADQVVLGQRTGIARRDFPFISQQNNNNFKVRYSWMDTATGLYGEGDVIEAITSKRRSAQLGFVKLGASLTWTNEFISDSPLSEVSNDVALANNRMVQLEDRCLFHQLMHWTCEESPIPATIDYCFVQLNVNSGEEPTVTELVSKMQSALLMLLTRAEDTINHESLRFYISPKAYIRLWDHPTLQQYQQSGITTQILRSDIPPFFSVPHTIASSIGYFDADGWNYADYDMFLIATGAAAVRTRSEMRMTPTNYPERETTGVVMTERLMPYVTNFTRMVRIGESSSLPIQELSTVRYRINDLTKTEDATRLVSLG